MKFIITTIALLLPGFFAISSLAQDVDVYNVAKAQLFQQTSAATPVADPTAPFSVEAQIREGTASSTTATLGFTGNAAPNPQTFVESGNKLKVTASFSSLAALNAAFNDGNFTFNISTATNYTRTLSITGGVFPTAPMLTVPSGDWLGGQLVIDPTQNYTFSWNSFANASGSDLIGFNISNSSLSSPTLAFTATGFTLPAGTLTPGTTFAAQLSFIHVTSQNAADANVGQGLAGYASEVDFTIQTVPEPSSWALLFAGAAILLVGKTRSARKS